MTFSEQLLDAIEGHDFSQSKILLRKALENDDPEVLASLAENLTDFGFSDLAKDVYRDLIAKFPKEDIFKVYLAEILFNDGNDNDALTLLYGISESSPAYLDSLLVQADYYQTEGLLEVAKDKLLKASEIAPKEDTIKFGLAELDFLAGEFEEAKSLYEDLLTREKQIGEVNLNQRLFQTEAKLGNYEEAAEIIKKHTSELLDIDSKYQAGVILLYANEVDDAIKQLDSVIDQSPDYVNAYPMLAQAYQLKNDYDQVLRSAQAGLAYNELDETLYSMGAIAAAKLGELETAEDLLQKGLKVAPDNSELRLQLSNVYLSERKYQDNIDLFAKLDDEDKDAQVHWNLAQSYQFLEDDKKAKSEYLLAYPDYQTNPDFLRQMIIFFNTQFDSKNIVLELLRKYLELKPEDYEMQDLYDDLAK